MGRLAVCPGSNQRIVTANRARGAEDIRRSRLGILGGSFDPVHSGHIALARAARDRHRLETVLFVPNRRPPHKGVRAAAHHRYRMVTLALEGEEGLEVTDREVMREGPSYTVDTLREIRVEEGQGCEIFFIIGADTLPELPTWKEFLEIADLARIVAVGRQGYPLDVEVALSGKVPDAVVRQIQGDAISPGVAETSSTAVRDRVRRGLPLEGWVSPSVADYISQNNLYVEAQEN